MFDEDKPLGTDGAMVSGAVSNVAVTVVFAFMVSVQVPVPVQAPLQPWKVEPDAGDAVSVTDVPEVDVWEQVDPQFTDPPETVPVPVPVFVTVRV